MADMSVQSAGILMFRRGPDGLRVLLVHPGGPWWAGKDEGAWSLPKGQFVPPEEPLDAARREFAEETGHEVEGAPLCLESVRQKGGKVVHAWAVEGDLDPASVRSTTFEMEWPPRSGKSATFPEVDRAAWFTIEEARSKLLAAQRPFLDRLERAIEA
jgi:predicted NUDIX family NTP pyrophosphohydrolase